MRRPLSTLILTLCTLMGSAAQAPSTATLVLRGHAQTVHVYGTRGRAPVIVSSGDGGWIHLGPHVAERLAARGYFVVGFDVKAYLESFTSGRRTLRAGGRARRLQVLVEFAAQGSNVRSRS